MTSITEDNPGNPLVIFQQLGRLTAVDMILSDGKMAEVILFTPFFPPSLLHMLVAETAVSPAVTKPKLSCQEISKETLDAGDTFASCYIRVLTNIK